MDITVICGRLDDNTFVRSYLLLQTLDDASITVYGVADESGLYPFFDDDRFEYRLIEASGSVRYVRLASNVSRLVRLLQKDIEDTDLLYFASGWKDTVIPGLIAGSISLKRFPTLLDVYDYTPWLMDFPLVQPSRFFDQVIASNRPLAEAIGGETIYTPADANKFNPQKYDSRSIRTELGFSSSDFVAGFIGTPREAKGVHHLIEAINRGGDDIRGLLVGVGKDEYSARLREIATDKIEILGPAPHSEIPRYYAALDTLVLPQEISSHTKYQIPAKLFEAMSMATPVIATRIGDIPHVIGDGGRIIDKPKPASINTAISSLRDEGTRSVGDFARERFLKNYSNTVIGRRYGKILSETTR